MLLTEKVCAVKGGVVLSTIHTNVFRTL